MNINKTMPPFLFINDSDEFKRIFPVKRIWWHIFSFLDLVDFMNISLTCKSFNYISQDDQLWRMLYNNYFPNSQFVKSFQLLIDSKKFEFDFSGKWKKKMKTFVVSKYGSIRPKCKVCNQVFLFSKELGGEYTKDRIYYCEKDKYKPRGLPTNYLKNAIHEIRFQTNLDSSSDDSDPESWD
eukprot:TRINITY_DN6057_c0_g1_i1.p1 TRINITY_DN6057_c0_g1~~TRINITY_DN6057_c0_g1_i1.p1  ORF type:complete len:188 (-),score=38.62 TRINITY_DN6057_c0_g1_i1:145-687(-)